jgi:hypothetical protein
MFCIETCRMFLIFCDLSGFTMISLVEIHDPGFWSTGARIGLLAPCLCFPESFRWERDSYRAAKSVILQ